MRLGPQRMHATFGGIPWWAFYVTGGLLLVVLPVLVWHRFRWLTLLLSLGPAAKALVLAFRQGRHLAAGGSISVFDCVFAVVAAVAAVMLLRAGISRAPGRVGPPAPDDRLTSG